MDTYLIHRQPHSASLVQEAHFIVSIHDHCDRGAAGSFLLADGIHHKGVSILNAMQSD